MAYIDLLWQLPAIFTAVPMLARLLPFRLPARAVPLFYFIVALIVLRLAHGRVESPFRSHPTSQVIPLLPQASPTTLA